MKTKELKPKKALNKAFLKVKPSRSDIEKFKTNLIDLLQSINDSESEEFHKNLVIAFLKQTYYDPNHFINTKGKNDLVIHTGKTAESSVGVIFEAKKPTNKAEMISKDNINKKAFHELVLYYLRERITHKNDAVKYLIATNINEWFVFDVAVFDRLFAQNRFFVEKFNDFENGRLADTKTEFFYKVVAEPFISEIHPEVEFTYFNLQDYKEPLYNQDKDDDSKLLPLFKLFSPEHLLKIPFQNDSNSLDKRFYSELLHIIGLTEIKDGHKKLIERNKPGERNTGSILEDAIIQLDSLDKISRLERPNQLGSTTQERLFNIALELTITWINRILFLKLLEAQLITYHKGNKSYSFLNIERIKSYDDLNSLFFQVLAQKYDERNEDVKKAFEKVPYLNSSLFEPTDLEQVTLIISNLRDDKKMPIFSQTVLKDSQGKRKKGNISTIEYIFEFLNAYDFSSEGSGEIQEDNKTLINASVLGLIFEKINGYKDGSFFTPGFITMYMCRETIKKAVVQKFNEIKNWNCKDLNEIFDKIDDKKEANSIINSLKICDPAVGSGHFLVSALNEIIAIKSKLKVLLDRSGKTLRDYTIEVENDDLIVVDDDGDLFEYNPLNKESQRIQETLFHEKQTIIENCLFGVDINPNSVKICRLRLWIELLKNAYYKNATELETLPNIDINIQCGNSLVSRFTIDSDLKQALKKSKQTIGSYRIAVDTYRNAENKEQKWEMKKFIEDIKSDFRSEISSNDPKVKKLQKLSEELFQLTKQTRLFEMSKKEEADQKKKVKQLTDETRKLEAEIEEIKANKIFENAFEWRFEFPEVLDENGNFLGFDVVIGNPPYGVKFEKNEKEYFKNTFCDVHVRTPESYNYFVKQFSIIANKRALCCLIVPSSFLNQAEFEKTRKMILSNHSLFLIINLGDAVFEDVATPTCIVGFDIENTYKKVIQEDLTGIARQQVSETLPLVKNTVELEAFYKNQSFSFVYSPNISIINKCYIDSPIMKEIAEEVATGVSSGLDKAYVFTKKEIEEKQLEEELLKNLVIGGEIHRFYINPISGKKLIYITEENNIDDYSKIRMELLKHKEQLNKRREAANGKIHWYSLNWPRRKKLFEEPKILIRQTANRIIAAYDDEKWYCLKSGIIIQLSSETRVTYKYILGLLNSTLMDYIYKGLVNEDNRIFPEVKPVQLFKLPIKIASYETQNIISNLVDEVISLKKQHEKTTSLEEEIDRFVYQLYGLEPEEIEIVKQASYKKP